METTELKANFIAAQPKALARLQITPKITLKEAQLALERIAIRNGCPACGFSGIHIFLEQVLDLRNDLQIDSILSARLEGLGGDPTGRLDGRLGGGGLFER